MATWRELKWFNRDVSNDLKNRINSVLSQKYDYGQEVNLLERVLLQYSMMQNGRFEHAFHGYFRMTDSGVLKHERNPLWDHVRRLILSNIPVIDDLHKFAGFSNEGYRSSLGTLMAKSLEHSQPSAKVNLVSDYSKVPFQHRQKHGDHHLVRVLATQEMTSEGEGNDYLLIHPHTEIEGAHHLSLIIVGSENRFRRKTQVPNIETRELMARRCESVFSLDANTVHPHVILTPPWMLDRHSLLKIHTFIGGVSPAYSDWLPYYNFSLPPGFDPDWAYQVKKDTEDEYYQL